MKLITARFRKTFSQGTLMGISFYETMSFVSVKAAENWFNDISKATALPYKIDDFYIEKPVCEMK